MNDPIILINGWMKIEYRIWDISRKISIEEVKIGCCPFIALLFSTVNNDDLWILDEIFGQNFLKDMQNGAIDNKKIGMKMIFIIQKCDLNNLSC